MIYSLWSFLYDQTTCNLCVCRMFSWFIKLIHTKICLVSDEPNYQQQYIYVKLLVLWFIARIVQAVSHYYLLVGFAQETVKHAQQWGSAANLRVYYIHRVHILWKLGTFIEGFAFARLGNQILATVWQTMYGSRVVDRRIKWHNILYNTVWRPCRQHHGPNLVFRAAELRSN